MKNLFLSLALVLVSSFSFANETIKNVEKLEIISGTVVESTIIEIDGIDYICYRTCYYKNGVRTHCTAWDCYNLLPTVTVSASVN